MQFTSLVFWGSGKQEQAKGFDAGELYEARLAVRNEKERNAAQQLKKAYGDKYDVSTMYRAERDTEKLLDEKEQKTNYIELQRIQSNAVSKNSIVQSHDSKKQNDVIL